jgi:hypothetical protein
MEFVKTVPLPRAIYMEAGTLAAWALETCSHLRFYEGRLRLKNQLATLPRQRFDDNLATNWLAPVSTSIQAQTKGFVLTQRTDCKSPRTIEHEHNDAKYGATNLLI